MNSGRFVVDLRWRGLLILALGVGVWGCGVPDAPLPRAGRDGVEARGVVWDEQRDGRMVRLTAKRAVWTSDEQVVRLEEATVNWRSSRLRARRLEYHPRRSLLRGWQVVMRRGALVLRGKKVVVDLEKNDLSARGVAVVLGSGESVPGQGAAEPQAGDSLR